MMNKKMTFSEAEQKKNDESNKLLNEWIEQVSKNKNTIDNGNVTKRSPARCFAKDGFFPGYFNQKRKILFIGRETRKIGGYDFRDTTKECFEDYLTDKNAWWRHLLRIVYGIKHNGQISFSKVPKATEIAEEMLETNDYGFALINISKFSNDSQNWQTNTSLVDRFLKDSELEKTDLFQRELKLLKPNIMITANLWDGKINTGYLNLCLPNEKTLLTHM